MNEQTRAALNHELKAKFERLVELSSSQMEALDNDRFDELAELLNDKDRLLREIDELHRQDAPDKGILSLLSDNSKNGESPTRELIERYRAHEKYVIRQLTQKMSLIGDRMRAMRTRRHAAKGYGSGQQKRSFIDFSR